MQITVKTFSCNLETYRKVYREAVTRLYARKGITIDPDEIALEAVDLPGDLIYAQRSHPNHSRTLTIFEDGELKYLIGFSNTNYDEDKRQEVLRRGGKYIYGRKDYHSNSYLCQGINKIFEYYYDLKAQNSELELFFYLLDTDETYASNLSNLLNYRKLATVGFEILNLDQINFAGLREFDFIPQENNLNIAYDSFNHFCNDITRLSLKNSGNLSSYIKCISREYEVGQETEDSEQLYIYVFKTLSAEQYDSFLTIWTLSVLAEREKKQLRFLLAPERYNYRQGQTDVRYATEFSASISRLFRKIGLVIEYETTAEIQHEQERAERQYTAAKQALILRNQELFKNNLRQKGVLTKCYLCGCEVEGILEAAHLWGVAEIRQADISRIDEVLEKPHMAELLDSNMEADEFYKKYVLANSGDNGIWLCRNHHGMFDHHYFCFDSVDGKVLLNAHDTDETTEYLHQITTTAQLPEEVLTARTKEFIAQARAAHEGQVSEF